MNRDQVPPVGTPVPYEVVTRAKDLPQAVIDCADRAMFTPGLQVLSEGDATYAILTASERPTGGFTLEPVSAIAGESGVELTVKLVRPKPGMMLLDAITYPQLILRFSNVSLPVVLLNQEELTR
ncbi:protease complex subunit PrcB family protein [Tumebacillus lipolyticus]|uniref:Protease complex subunit PrcB family protein n=1 Tax=Tumebacillus lipolyticus TaxID=1280370 RepID=A0ABW5A1X5_9BACL